MTTPRPRPAEQPTAFATDVRQAPAYWRDAALWSVLVAADQTRGAFTLIEQLMPRKDGPPPHVHERASEIFYILDGQITFQVGLQVITAGAGTAVFIPAGTPHTFHIDSETARALNMYTPGGFDDTIRLLATPAGALTLPPEGAVHEPTPEQQRIYTARVCDLHTKTWADLPNLLKDPQS